MTSNKGTNAQTTESEPEITYVRELTITELVGLGLRVFLYTWFGMAFLLLFMAMFGFALLQNTLVLYGFWFFVPIIFVILVSQRNRLFRNGFKRPDSHRKYLQFTYIWPTLVLVSTIAAMFYYIVYGFHDPRYFVIPLVVFFFFLAAYIIFDEPLTQEGEIAILFEMLSSYSNNFHEAQQYWKRIAKKVESMLRAGNIQLSSKDLVYSFSKKLLETNDDISNDLLSVRNWMLGRQRSCFEAIKHINSEVKLVPRQRNILLDWILKNPDKTIKYVGLLIAVFAALSPTLGVVLNYLHSVFG